MGSPGLLIHRCRDQRHAADSKISCRKCTSCAHFRQIADHARGVPSDHAVPTAEVPQASSIRLEQNPSRLDQTISDSLFILGVFSQKRATMY